MRRRKRAWQKAAQQGLGSEGEGEGPPVAAAGEGETTLNERVRLICEDGRRVWDTFETEIRQHRFHTFVPGDYECVLRALTEGRGEVAQEGQAPRFLELGSATGVIAILADLLGYEAWGIEIDPHLVEVARTLAQRHGSGARFAAGSYLPEGYEWKDEAGDARMGTIGLAAPAYADLGHPLEYFDVVYAYPWQGEEEIFHDLMAQRAGRDARLILHGGEGEVSLFRGGKAEAPAA